MVEGYEPVKHPAAPKKGGDFPLMPGDHPIARIMFKGVFDWDSVYKFIKRWFNDRGYFFEEGTYKTKSDTFGKEEEFKWKGWRKVDEYYKFNIKIEMHSWGLRPVEVIEKGKKKKLYKGKFIMEFYGDVETDYQGMWRTSKFALNVKNFIDRFFWKGERMALYVDQLYYIITKFHSEIKEHLKMHSQGNAYKDNW